MSEPADAPAPEIPAPLTLGHLQMATRLLLDGCHLVTLDQVAEVTFTTKTVEMKVLQRDDAGQVVVGSDGKPVYGMLKRAVL